MQNFIGLIPARYASSRFPGKPLCDLLGKPMIQRVYEQAIKWEKFDKVYVITDSIEIQMACYSKQIPCLMTSPDCKDCLDRAWEASQQLESSGQGADRYIIIQGDEPLFNPDTLNIDYDHGCINFYTQSLTDKDDPNAVKVVMSNTCRAMYFSRFSIPYRGASTQRAVSTVPCYKQIGVYAFSIDMLRIYHELEPSTLENTEGVGLNRLLENDYEILMRHTPHDSISVDTPEDREKVIEIMKGQL